MKLKKLISLLLCLILTFSCVLPIVSCKKKNKNEGGSGNTGGTIIGGDPEGNTEYTVKVVTVGGMPLEGVMVYIHSGDGYQICTLPQETDKNGIAKFTLKTSNDYSVQVDGAPEGYNVREGLTREDRYPLTAPDTVITLSSAPIAEGGFADRYEVGDVMHDFTITDINGDDYKLSELLKTKDMVMLNFWYVGCSNCAKEFPYLNRVYEAYKDDVAVLALNDYADDTFESLTEYNELLHKPAPEGWDMMEEDENLSIPLFKIENDEESLTLNRFGDVESLGYPTSVVIDRYGVVTMIEVGAVLGDSKWKNVFDHFVGENYKQSLVTDPSILNPIIEPTIKWTDESEQQIADAFNSGDITVSYHPETSDKDAKYAWPFIADKYNGEDVVRPSNEGIDNSFAILYAEVSLKPGQAVMFDYFCSTQNDDYGKDVLYVLVDGKDIYSMAGISEDGYETCCTYVDPRPVTESNKNDIATYSISFVYYKDDVDHDGDDTVYLKNLRVISAEDIPVETYIFRYASTDLNESGNGYNTYVNVYLASDGYYRVGDPAKDTDNPLLFVNHLGYTHFDANKTISDRAHLNYELMVNGVNMFNNWLIYGKAASNSQMYGYTPVTEELKTMLVAYCNTYKNEVGKADSENLWLQLCVYYDAYGTVDGVKTPHLSNPIVGLTSFSAYVMDVKDPANGAYESGEIVSTAEVEYTHVMMPRGYLYKFVPKKSGVYRVRSRSEQEVLAWIFVDGEKWAEEGDRTMLTSDSVGERWNPDLLVDSDNDGNYELDYTNISIAAYMEAGKEYYIDVAFYDQYAVGSFEFDVKWVADEFEYFIQASPGPITYIESITGGMGQLLAAGIDVDFKTEGGVEYAYHVLKRDADGTVTDWGSKIYADFFYPTTLFPSQSIETLINANAFNYTITAHDRQALIYLDDIRLSGKSALISKWIADGTVADKDAGEAKWTSDGINDAVKDFYDGDFDNSYAAQIQVDAIYVWTEGTYAIMKDWALEEIDGMSSAKWDSYKMSDVISGKIQNLSGTQQELLDQVNALYNKKWAEFQMDDVRCGIFHNTDKRTAKDIKAQEYLDILETDGKAELMALWDDLFSSIEPPAKAPVCRVEHTDKDEDLICDICGESTDTPVIPECEGEHVDENGDTDCDLCKKDMRVISEWRYEYLWNYYKMDDVKAGIFHGTNEDFTDVVRGYLAKVDEDNPLVDNLPTYPERQGCVAVTRELAEILDTLIGREIFENVHNGWLKFCYYYDYLGA